MFLISQATLIVSPVQSLSDVMKTFSVQTLMCMSGNSSSELCACVSGSVLPYATAMARPQPAAGSMDHIRGEPDRSLIFSLPQRPLAAAPGRDPCHDPMWWAITDEVTHRGQPLSVGEIDRLTERQRRKQKALDERHRSSGTGIVSKVAKSRDSSVLGQKVLLPRMVLQDCANAWYVRSYGQLHDWR